MPPDESLPLEQVMLGLTVLCAIPATLYALWVDAFEREKKDAHEGRDDVEDRARRLYFGSLLALVAQILLYLATRQLRMAFPVASILPFLVAVIVQGRIQAVAERKILKAVRRESELRPANVTPLPPAPAPAAGTAAWMALALGGYFGSILVVGGLAYAVARLFGAPDGLAALAGFLGTTLGIFLGLALTYALSPKYLRNLFACAPLEEKGATRALIEECYARAGLSAPKTFVIEGHGQRGPANALLAGFSGGKGPFAPALFLTRSLVSEFPADELRAVVLHEVAHVALGHLRKRFTYSLGVVLAAVVFGAAVLVASHALLAPEVARGFRLFLPLVAFVAPFFAIRRLVKFQELEADSHAVIRLGADLKATEGALRRLARSGGVSGAGALEAHPATEDRIARLRVLCRTPETQATAPEEKIDRAA